MTAPFSSWQSPANPSQSAPPSGFPQPASIAPASFTPTSAHASHPLQPSTSAQQLLTQPNVASSNPASTVATPPLPPPPPPTITAPAAAATATTSANGPKVLPYLFDDAQLEDVLVLVIDMLVKLTEHNDSLPLHPSALTRFHSRATPNITLSAYLRRIAKYTSIEKCCILILLVYIDRVCERLEGFTICGLTVHRFICAAILCASKALCDAFNTNEHYAKVGGISLQEINLLEKEFLQIIDWRLTCTGQVLQHYYASLVRSHSDYVLATPPPTAVGKGKAGVVVGGDVTVDLDAPAHASASDSGSSGSGRVPDGISPATAAGVLAGSSQHSSPFPISSSSASPFTPATTATAAAMQVDSAPAPPQAGVASAPNSRRRKDEQRTPPSPRMGMQAGLAVGNGLGNGNGNESAFGSASSGGGVLGHAEHSEKRTRFDPYPPPPQQYSQPQAPP